MLVVETIIECEFAQSGDAGANKLASRSEDQTVVVEPLGLRIDINFDQTLRQINRAYDALNPAHANRIEHVGKRYKRIVERLLIVANANAVIRCAVNDDDLDLIRWHA